MYMGLKYAHLGTAHYANKYRKERGVGQVPGNGNLGEFVKNKNIGFLSWGDPHPGDLESFPEYRGFNLIRDPRDIIVSGYFHHRSTHSIHEWVELADHRKRLKSVSVDEGLMLEMDFLVGVLERMEIWDYNLENVKTYKMEDIVDNPYESILDIFRNLDLVDDSPCDSIKRFPGNFAACVNGLIDKNPFGKHMFRIRNKRIPIEMLLKVIYDNRFSQHSGGRARGEENSDSHFRKGICGDWINHFTPRHKDAFKKKYNHLLVKLGYEKDDSW